MQKGELINQILDECPTEFHETLKSWIDDIEQSVNEIKDKLDITKLDELEQIEEAKSIAEDLCDGLY